MNIKILNKNKFRATPISEWVDAIFSVDEGAILTENYNETLDTGIVVISNQTKRIEIEPYDIVEILDDSDNHIKYMCVDTYSEQMIGLNPKIYRYEISLFSETKQLENTILPNLKITHLWNEDGTPGRSVYFYITQYMSEYCPQIKVGDNNTYSSTRKFEYLTQKLEDKFDNIECPEMQWNQPTLREVLNDLMMVADCIPIIKDGVLDFIDLTEEKSDIAWYPEINYVSRSRSSEDYVSELQVKLENVTNTQNGTNNLVTLTEYVPFSISDNEAVIATDNVFVRTQYPIYKLKSLTMMFPGSYNSGSSHQTLWFSGDLMKLGNSNRNYVYEYAEWITKKVFYQWNWVGTPPAIPADVENYQNWTIYYNRGSNEIKNFVASVKDVWYPKPLWQWFQELIMAGAQSSVQPGDSVTNANHYNTFFKVEYETLEGCLFRASKGEYPGHDRVIIDNQTNSYVDSYKQGFLEYQKANRLGNEQLQINARFELPSIKTLIQIGHTYKDEDNNVSLIYQCQYQYYKDHIEINALATKNYVLREYFTGVKSKIRSWKIVDGSEALTRHDLIKYYCEFDYREIDEITDLTSSINFEDGMYYFLSPLVRSYEIKPVRTCFIRTKYRFGPGPAQTRYYPSNSQYFNIDLISRIIGNSLVFTFALSDNYMIGRSYCTYENNNGGEQQKYITEAKIVRETLEPYRIGLDDVVIGEGGIPTINNPYTNDNGEFTEIDIVYADGIKVNYIQDDYADVISGTNWLSEGNITTQTVDFLYSIYQRPVTYETNIVGEVNDTSYNYEKMSTSLFIRKDSQEIINISTQIEFCSDYKDIAFSKLWLQRQKAVRTENNNNTFRIHIFRKDVYDYKNPDVLPSEVHNWQNVVFEYSDNSSRTVKFSLKLDDTRYSTLEQCEAAMEELFNYDIIESQYLGKCVYVTDTSGNVLLLLNNIPNENLVAKSYASPNGSYYHIVLELYLNLLSSRDKNIYDTDNHYVIVRNLNE